MTKVTIRITPKHGTINTRLPGEYFHKDKKRVIFLTTGGEVITSRPINTEAERIDSISFTKQKREHVLEFDWDGSDKSRETKEKQVKWFYENHPMVDVAGGVNTFMQQDLFLLENLNNLTDAKVNEIKEKIRIANIVLESGVVTQRDISFAFGGNPLDMTDKELFVDLLDPHQGRLMVNWSEFENKWNPELNKDIQYVIIAKKAVALGIISVKNNNYMIGQEVVGANANFDSVVAYFKSSPNRFDYIKSEVRRKDGAEKASNTSEMPEGGENGKIDSTLEDLKTRAKELGIKGWQIKKAETLEADIENAEKILAERDGGNSSNIVVK